MRGAERIIFAQWPALILVSEAAAYEGKMTTEFARHFRDTHGKIDIYLSQYRFIRPRLLHPGRGRVDENVWHKISQRVFDFFASIKFDNAICKPASRDFTP